MRGMMFFTADELGNLVRPVYNRFVGQTIAERRFSLYCGVVLVHNPFDNVNGTHRRFLYSGGNVKRPSGRMGQRLFQFVKSAPFPMLSMYLYFCLSVCLSSDSVKTWREEKLNRDVSNQQDVTTFSFINLLNQRYMFSGDKFAHPQEHFLTIRAALDTMHWHCCRPVPRSTVALVGSSVGALYQKLYIQSKSAPEDGRICRPKYVGLI